MKNPIRQLINRIKEWKKHLMYCEHWKDCSNFRADQPRCTQDVGIGCGKNDFWNEHRKKKP